MTSFRIPGVLRSSQTLRLDAGTLGRWFSTAPPSVGASPPSSPQRHSYRESRVGGFAASTLTMSPEAVELLQAIETLRLQPYDDQTGEDIDVWVKGATIGYGHLIAEDDWDTYKDGITAEQAADLFRADAEPFERTVGEVISVGVQQYEFDAMVILAFNIGRSGFRNSSVATLVNDPSAETSFATLEAAWKAWNKSQGRVNRGLVNRRDAEWRIYTSAIYARW